MSNRFAEIYANNEWWQGSGEGSLEINTRGYRAFLQGFLCQYDVKSVVDIGCGDWQFSKFINWNGVDYQGYDVVPSIVATNIGEYAKSNIRFFHYSGDPRELPGADLLLVKDVLQHLPHQDVLDFLPSLSKYKFALITNCTNPKGKDLNEDIELGGFRHLDLRLPPFNLNAKLVYSFNKFETSLVEKFKIFIGRHHHSMTKNVLLVHNDDVYHSQNGGVTSLDKSAI